MYVSGSMAEDHVWCIWERGDNHPYLHRYGLGRCQQMEYRETHALFMEIKG